MATVKWKRAGKKWTLKEALSVGTIRLRGMNTEERAELAQFLKSQFSLRLSQFTKSGTIGYAVHKLAKDMEYVATKMGMKMDPFMNVVTSKGKSRMLAENFASRKNPQNALATYITLMQDFFTAKSSTVRGWREIGENQDRELFGEITTIKPGRLFKKKQNLIYEKQIAYRMTDAERITFWSVYDMLRKTRWTPLTQKYAAGGQKDFSSMWMTGSFNKKDIDDAYAEMTRLMAGQLDHIEEHRAGTPLDPTQQEGDFVDNVLTEDQF